MPGRGNVRFLFSGDIVYSIPVSNEFGALTVEGDQAATNTDFVTMDRYDGGATNIDLGFDLSDQGDFGYIVLVWASGEISSEANNVGVLELRQDDGASDGTTPATAGGASGNQNRVVDVGSPDAGYDWQFSMFRPLPSSGDNSEFGLWFVEGGAVTVFNLRGATLIALPVEYALNSGVPSFTGSHLLESKTFRVNPGDNDPWGDTGSADTDVESTGASFTVTSAGQYLILHSMRFDGPDQGFSGSYRWTVTKDGEDIFGVKTNTATSGATRTGRGFQIHASTGASGSKVRHNYGSFVVKQLNAGSHEFKNVTNKHDSANDDGERLLNDGLYAIKTDQFEQFQHREDTTAVAVTSGTFADWNNGVTVIGDGTTQFIIGVSSTVHANNGSEGVDFQITRNGSAITSSQISRSVRRGGFGTTGSGDSDNATIPVSILIVDTPPEGDATYKLQYRELAGAGDSIFNCNDNGASGFKGTMFAASISLNEPVI